MCIRDSPQTLSIGTVDLNTVADGEYIGVCQNKILFAVVKVEVQDHKITDIARRLGYTDNHYFSKAFKNYYHISPAQYRSSHVKTPS